MMQGMARFYVLLFLLMVGLTAVAMISCLSAENGEVRSLPRGLWVVVILLFPLVGPGAYFAWGRPVPVGGGAPRPVAAPKARPVAPDDDPDFLRRLKGLPAPTERPRRTESKPRDTTPKPDVPRTDEARSTDDSSPNES
jgi:hypothetical protein